MNSLTIGWTLIHSLWQGLLIFALLKIAARIFPKAESRYGLGVGALLLILVSSVITFLTLNEGAAGGESFTFVINAATLQVSEQQSSVLDFINSNIIWLIRFWMLGFVIGMVRIAAGLLYINRLRKHAHPVADEWAHLVDNLSLSLNIRRVVVMAEASITSPMVVGFMKPVILFPFGLLTGLTPEQVETILVHELAHIRRQDYIINLFQAVVETIFFFNPFVILISSFIREERENCCDDMVIEKGISPISYVRTLAQLEAARSSTHLALGISGNKNQLLNRIKRIMENSAKNDWGKGRLVPVALVFLGLICASWLSIGSDSEAKVSQNIAHNAIAADTNKKELKLIKRGSKKYFNEPTEPTPPADVPEIEFVPDDVDPGFTPMPDFAFAMPAIPMEALESLEGLSESLEALQAMPYVDVTPEAAPSPFGFDFDNAWRIDSIPGFRFQGNAEEWEKFEEQFTKKFKEQFKDFYEKNQEQMNKMMEEMKKERRESAEVVDLGQLRRGMDAYRMEDWLNLRNKIYVPKTPDMEQSDADMARAAEKMAHLESFKENQYELQEPLRIMSEKMDEQRAFLEEMASNAESYKSELTRMLRDDGYLEKSGEINQLNIQDNGGDLTINGKKIKEKDQLKYRALHDRFFQPKYKREGRRSE